MCNILFADYCQNFYRTLYFSTFDWLLTCNLEYSCLLIYLLLIVLLILTISSVFMVLYIFR